MKSRSASGIDVIESAKLKLAGSKSFTSLNRSAASRGRRGRSCLGMGRTTGSGEGGSWAAEVGSLDCSASSGCDGAGVALMGTGLSTVPLVDLRSVRVGCTWGALDAQLAVDGKAGRSALGLCDWSLSCRAIGWLAEAIGCCGCGGGALPMACCADPAFRAERSALE